MVQLSITCDENDDHVATLYCITCSTHLCVDCAESTHSTRTLARHKRVLISEKPRESPPCAVHPQQRVEFTCLEEACQAAPLMCYICKDYGRHVAHKVSDRTSVLRCHLCALRRLSLLQHVAVVKE